jgi:hypothetical protein
MGAVLSKRKPKTRNTARSKLTQEFIERLAADFKVYGEEVIQQLRESAPAKYAEVISKLVPAELLVHQDESADLSEMSFEELKEFMIGEMREIFGVEIVASPLAVTDQTPAT